MEPLYLFILTKTFKPWAALRQSARVTTSVGLAGTVTSMEIAHNCRSYFCLKWGMQSSCVNRFHSSQGSSPLIEFHLPVWQLRGKRDIYSSGGTVREQQPRSLERGHSFADEPLLWWIIHGFPFEVALPFRADEVTFTRLPQVEATMARALSLGASRTTDRLCSMSGWT